MPQPMYTHIHAVTHKKCGIYFLSIAHASAHVYTYTRRRTQEVWNLLPKPSSCLSQCIYHIHAVTHKKFGIYFLSIAHASAHVYTYTRRHTQEVWNLLPKPSSCLSPCIYIYTPSHTQEVWNLLPKHSSCLSPCIHIYTPSHTRSVESTS